MSTATQAPNAPARQTPQRRPGPSRPSALPAVTIDPLRVLRRHMLTIIFSAIVGAVLGVGAFYALRIYYPLYMGEVLFEVRPTVQGATDIGTQEITNDDLVVRIANTETYLLTSRDVLREAVTNSEVYETAWHKKFMDGTVLDVDEAVEELEEDLRAGAVRGSNLFRLAWSNAEPEDVKIVLDLIEEAYMEKRTELDSSVYDDNLDLFRSQLRNHMRDLDLLNGEIKSFIREKGITTLSDPRFSQLASLVESMQQQLQEQSTNLNLLTTANRLTSQKIQGTMEPTQEDYVVAESDPTIQLWDRQILQLRTDLRVQATNYQPDHPVIRELRTRLEASEAEREEKLQEILRRNLDAQLKQQADQIEQILSVTEDLEKEIEGRLEELKQLTADQSEYGAKEDQRTYLEAARDSTQQIINEIELMRLRSDAARIRVLQQCETPRVPAFPDIFVIPPMGVLLTMGLTIGLIFLREVTDQRVKGASDLSIIPGTRMLGVVPEMYEDPTRIKHPELAVRRHPTSVLAESYRQTTSAITSEMDRAGHQLLLLAGGLPGAGTTTIATNLGSAAAGAGRRVLIIDANFRRPRLASALGIESAEIGLGDVLAETATLDSAIIAHEESGVDVLPAGSPQHRVFERLSDTHLDELLATVRSTYDLVLIDAPPAVVAGDAMVLANKVDAIALVVRANQEQRGLVARLMHQFNGARGEMIGLILNRPRGTAGGYFKKNYAAMAQYAQAD